MVRVSGCGGGGGKVVTSFRWGARACWDGGNGRCLGPWFAGMRCDGVDAGKETWKRNVGGNAGLGGEQTGAKEWARKWARKLERKHDRKIDRKRLEKFCGQIPSFL